MTRMAGLCVLVLAACRPATNETTPAPQSVSPRPEEPKEQPAEVAPPPRAALTPERQQFIRNLANDEWVDDVDPNTDDATFERISKEWSDKTDAFLAARTPPAELHAFADAWNWDGGVQRMREVIEHPNCDRGTALLVYWRASPQFYEQFASRDAVPEWSRETYDLILEIERRYTSGDYENAAIPYDPVADGAVETEPEPEEPIRRAIPKVMFEPVGG